MKKTLLAAAALFTAATSFASVDVTPYATTNGITCENIWLNARARNADDWNAYPFAEMYAKVRTATLLIDDANAENNKILVGWSKTGPTGETSADGTALTNDFATVGIINFGTGKWEKEVALTCDGAPIAGLLCANQIGVDQYGHIYVGGYVATTETTPIRVYHVKDINTGECELAAELQLPADESAATGRMDYFHVIGDVTGEENGAVFMCALADPAASPYVYRWRLDQGGTASDWYGDFDGYVAWDCSKLETYPVDQTSWGTAPVCTMILTEDFAAENFYVDGFTTCPVIYNTSAGVVDGFMNAPSEYAPATGTNGVAEFNLGGKDFIAYSVAQYNATPGCQVRVAEIPELAFSNMQSYWLLPEAGLGETSDGGTRVHNVSTFIHTDANGKQGCYLLTYKCNNGAGVYQIAEEGYEPVYKAGVEGIIADEVNAPAEYYNLQGVKVANPENGLYIVKRGNKATKEVVVK
ncbi:MAG: hypothetical protein IJY30_02540 [Muribaculaceae bacterium]|nr:hypothetical protein [Muribaculaceae bacterium]